MPQHKVGDRDPGGETVMSFLSGKETVSLAATAHHRIELGAAWEWIAGDDVRRVDLPLSHLPEEKVLLTRHFQSSWKPDPKEQVWFFLEATGEALEATLDGVSLVKVAPAPPSLAFRFPGESGRKHRLVIAINGTPARPGTLTSVSLLFTKAPTH